MDLACDERQSRSGAIAVRVGQTIIARDAPLVVPRTGEVGFLREDRAVAPHGDVLDPVLHRLRAGELTAAQWCRIPGAGSRARMTVAGDAVVVEIGDGARALLTATPLALPVRTRTVDRIAVGPVLSLLPDIDGMFAELRRCLAPHGLLSVLLPAPASFASRAGALPRAVRKGWRHRSVVEHPEWLAASADFAVLADDRLDFTIVDPGDAATEMDALCAAGLYPPTLPREVRARAAAHGTAARKIRLRRIVARR